MIQRTYPIFRACHIKMSDNWLLDNGTFLNIIRINHYLTEVRGFRRELITTNMERLIA